MIHARKTTPGVVLERSFLSRFLNRLPAIFAVAKRPAPRRDSAAGKAGCRNAFSAAVSPWARPLHSGRHPPSSGPRPMAPKRPPALDRIDIKILAALQRDGRATMA